MSFDYKLGVGLIPTKRQVDSSYSLARIISSQHTTSFVTTPGISIPHVTLFQGKFKDESSIVEKLKKLDTEYLNVEQQLTGLSVWANNIVFLNCKKRDDLQQLHEAVYESLFPLCEGVSADPQKFDSITAGQQKSLDKTGYPFSGAEYMPHFTIAHLEEKVAESELNKLSEKLTQVRFEKLVIYRVGKKGACTEFIYTKQL